MLSDKPCGHAQPPFLERTSTLKSV